MGTHTAVAFDIGRGEMRAQQGAPPDVQKRHAGKIGVEAVEKVNCKKMVMI